MAKKKKEFTFTPNEGVEENIAAVTSLLKRSTGYKSDPGPVAEEVKQKTAGRTAHMPALRRKPAEKRTINKQMKVTPAAYENVRKWAEKAGVSFNEALNYIVTRGNAAQIQVSRKRPAETKTRRIIFLVTPTLHAETQAAADAQSVSFNEYVCYLMENAGKVKV